MTILDVDGQAWADFLRYRMNDRINERLTTEQSWLLTSKERFAELMVGNTVYKRESDERARWEREQQQLEAKSAAAKAKKGEKGKRLKLKNPMRLTTRPTTK